MIKILASQEEINELIEEVRKKNGFDLEVDPREPIEVLHISADERLTGPFNIANRDIRTVLKITTYRQGVAYDIQFIVIDCEGDILNHDAYGIEDLNFDTLRAY